MFRSLKGEMEVFGAVTIVAILNILLFTNLSIAGENKLQIFIQSPSFLLSILALYAVATITLAFTVKRYFMIPFFALLAFLTLYIFTNLYLVIIDPHVNDNGAVILTDAAMIWIVSLLVFSLWYWTIDRGGPIARVLGANKKMDLLFPQTQTKVPGWEEWKPHYIDYVFFSFFTSTGFSPADTLPLSKKVKFLMMVEASISLVIIGMVASRAISLLQ